MGQIVDFAPQRSGGGIIDWGDIAALLVVPHLVGLNHERLVSAGFDDNGHLCCFSDVAGEADHHDGLLAALRQTLASPSVSTVLIAHNHPAGDARASMADREATRRAAALCRLAGATLADHWIIADGTIISLCGSEPAAVANRAVIDACQRQMADL